MGRHWPVGDHLTVPGIPGAITQSTRLDLVDRDVAEVIELMTGEKPGSYGLRLTEHLPGVGGKLAGETRRLRAESAALATQASAVMSEAVERYTSRDSPIATSGR